MKGRSAGVRMIGVLALLFTGACEFYHYEIPSPDRLWHIIPWFDHMITARYVRPYETADVPRYTPVGTVPVSGGEPDWSAEWTTGKTTTADALAQPVRAAERRAPLAGRPRGAQPAARGRGGG